MQPKGGSQWPRPFFSVKGSSALWLLKVLVNMKGDSPVTYKVASERGTHAPLAYVGLGARRTEVTPASEQALKGARAPALPSPQMKARGRREQWALPAKPKCEVQGSGFK